MKRIFQEIMANVFNDIPNKHNAWLEAIDAQDDLTALHSASQGLEQAFADTGLSPQLLSKILDKTEQKTAPVLLRLNQQFIKFQYMDASLENNILAVVYAFHKQLYTGYVTLLEHYASPSETLDSIIGPLMHHAVEQAFQMLKWRSFINFGLAPKMWLQLHKVFTLAANYDLLDSTLSASDFDTPSPTLAARLIQTYMLDNLQQANLSRIGVDVACKLLQTQLLDVEISQEFNPIKYLFFVDIEKDQGAKRMRHFTPTNTCIYWHIDGIETFVSNIVDSKLNAHALASLNVPAHHTKAAIEALTIIQREWSRKEYQRQRRKETRQKITSTANVVYGIQEVCKRIHAQENLKLNQGARVFADGKTLDERLRNHTAIKGEANKLKVDPNNHHWVIVDESSQGLGAVANRELNAWITVGQLLGLVLANGKNEMVLGIVKSIRPKANHQVNVGIAIISRHAKWVQLKSMASTALDNNVSIHSFAALYLPIEAGLSQSSTLLIPKIEFIPNIQYEISISGMVEEILLNQPIDSQDDWVRVNYPR
jgi:hypothetical protein